MESKEYVYIVERNEFYEDAEYMEHCHTVILGCFKTEQSARKKIECEIAKLRDKYDDPDYWGSAKVTFNTDWNDNDWLLYAEYVHEGMNGEQPTHFKIKKYELE